MADSHNNDDQKTLFEAAKDSPVADAVPPESFFVAAKRLPELRRVRTTANPFIEKTEDFGRCGERVQAFGLPTLIVQEGGYALGALGECLSAFLDGVA